RWTEGAARSGGGYHCGNVAGEGPMGSSADREKTSVLLVGTGGAAGLEGVLRAEGVELTLAGDVDTASELLKVTLFDAIVVGVSAQSDDGAEPPVTRFCGRWPDIPVIAS